MSAIPWASQSVLPFEVLFGLAKKRDLGHDVCVDTRRITTKIASSMKNGSLSRRHFLGTTVALAGAAFVLGRRALLDIPTVLIALVTIGLLIKFKKLQEPLIILAAGIAGIALKSLVST